MTIFVAHCQTDKCVERSQMIVSRLQKENPSHCFIPAAVAFRHLYNGDFKPKDIFDIELDLLMNCDQMILISKPSVIMENQIDYCRMVGMEVVDLAEKYRSI